jgi:signal transduction histidine kinase
LFIDPSSHHTFKEYVETVQAGRNFEAQAIDIRKDGTPFYIEVHGTGFTYKGKPHMLAVVRDITERVQAYEKLEQHVAERTRELSTLLDVSHNVASTLDLKLLLGLILDQLKYVADYSGAAIRTVEGEGLSVLDMRLVGADPSLAPARHVPIVRFGVIWEHLSRGEPVIIHDIHDDDLFARTYRDMVGDALENVLSYMRSWLAVPLMLKDRVIGLLSLSHRETGFYTQRHARLAMAVANQAAVAIENARLYERAQEFAALEERQRLARELHDSVSQAIFSITLHARTAHTLLKRGEMERLAEPIDHVFSLAQAAMAEMRALIFELRPESLQNEGLVAALTKQVASIRARHGIEVAMSLCAEPDVPLEVKEALYRIAQEALHNTVKHSRATRADLRMEYDGKRATLEVKDNGIGFDANGQFPGHLGLQSMRERAARMEGILQIESSPGKGTIVRVDMPGASSE